MVHDTASNATYIIADTAGNNTIGAVIKLTGVGTTVAASDFI